MSTNWHLVPLGEILSHRKEFIEIDDLEPYKRCRVQLHAQGIVLRDLVPGAEIKTKKQQVCRAGEFLVAEIDAKLGGYGIVPNDLDGSIVSSHYFLFGVNEENLDRSFLGYFIRTQAFFEQVAAQGSTNYAAIRPGHVLEYTIPLPDLTEQRRLVERLDALVAKIEEAKWLRAVSDKKRHQLTRQAAETLFQNNSWPHEALHKLLIEDSRNGIGTRPNDERPGVPILRISAGTSRPDAVVDENDHKFLVVTKKQLEQYLLRKDDLLACRFNGNLHFVGRFSIYHHDRGIDQVYPDKLIRFRVDQSRVLPEFVKLAMNSPTGRKRIESFCATTAGNIGISATELKTVPVPVPPLEVQEAVIDHLHGIQRSVTAADEEADKIKCELDAMLPAILNRAFRGELLS